jgi:hypothetical protein
VLFVFVARRYLPTATRDLLLLPSASSLADSAQLPDPPGSTGAAPLPAAPPSFGYGLAALVRRGPPPLAAGGGGRGSLGADGNGQTAARLWSLHFHQRAAAQGNHESFVAVGDAYFYGTGVDGPPGRGTAAVLSSGGVRSGGSSSRGGGDGSGGGGGSTESATDASCAVPAAPNYEGALWWYSRAAAANVAKGAYSLGYMYERGLGAPASEARAERHYEKVRL